MSDKTAYIGADIFDGQQMRTNCALLINGDRIDGIVSVDALSDDYTRVKLSGGLLTSGFIDLQVNGGGGVLLNQDTSIQGIQTICEAHLQFGTTSLLPTLITDAPDITKRAIDAAIEAESANLPGFLGLHLEGPHLSMQKKGAHSPDLIRHVTDQDIEILCEAKQSLSKLLITIAPESVNCDQISQLASCGIHLSLGHSAATSQQAKEAFTAGISSVTHLYNAMSPLTHREPGIVGAALNTDDIYCGLIADGFHVNADAINIALKMKTGRGKLMLVTDAMSTIGRNQDEFELNGRMVKREGGRLTLSDGTLAGADLDMISAVRFMIEHTCCDRFEALRMASSYPAQYLNLGENYGHLKKGAYANFLHLTDEMDISSIWQNGRKSS
ncbi:MAG: N-acetylglucosamine-6-phosphate deacetylase [Rhizobiaceae bacterium]|nr:N-acetylglucosamine-6-phosphate deacetylase [Rhizobiaceae bacterium]